MGRDGGRLLGCEAISHARLHHEAAAARLLARPGCKLARVMALQAIHGGGGMRRVRDEEERPGQRRPGRAGRAGNGCGCRIGGFGLLGLAVLGGCFLDGIGRARGQVGDEVLMQVRHVIKVHDLSFVEEERHGEEEDWVGTPPDEGGQSD